MLISFCSFPTSSFLYSDRSVLVFRESLNREIAPLTPKLNLFASRGEQIDLRPGRGKTAKMGEVRMEKERRKNRQTCNSPRPIVDVEKRRGWKEWMRQISNGDENGRRKNNMRARNLDFARGRSRPVREKFFHRISRSSARGHRPRP